MIKVVQIMESTIGGTRRHLNDIVFGLDGNIFEVSVICSTRRNPAFFDDIALFRDKGIKVFIVQMERVISPFFDLMAFINLYSLLRRENYHIVHTHSSKAGFLGRIAARLAGVPVILYTPHCFSFQAKNSLLINRFYIALECFAARFTDRIVTVSHEEKKSAIIERVCRPSMLEVIENGVNIETFQNKADVSELRQEFKIRDDQKVVGTVARFCPQKGYKHLIKAAREVIKICPQAIFLLIGDGVLWPKIKRMVERLNLSKHIIMTGHRKDLPNLYAMMDLFVLPSLWEGTPYAILEAMASGKPIVATLVSGTQDIIIQGETGLLVPPEDPKALSQAIICLLKDKELAKIMGQNGRRLIWNNYQLKDQIRKLEGFYIRMFEEKLKDILKAQRTKTHQNVPKSIY